MAFVGPFARPVYPPFGGEEAAANPWYDPTGAFAADGGNLYAWRAQNSPGTIWPGGPANYAATLTDESSGVVLVEGNGAVPWAAATGWGFVAAALQYFLTGVIPDVSTQQWSMAIQFNGVIIAGANVCLVGCYTIAVPVSLFYIYPDRVINTARYANGNGLDVAPSLATGNLAVCGDQGYRNGVADGGIIPGTGGANIRDVWIGCLNNNGAPQFYVSGNIGAVWIYDQNPALVQAQAVLAGGFRAAMGQL